MFILVFLIFFFFFKQKTAYEMRISDWSSDVCSSDLFEGQRGGGPDGHGARQAGDAAVADIGGGRKTATVDEIRLDIAPAAVRDRKAGVEQAAAAVAETHPGFPGADLVVEEAPHEIPVDGEAAGAETFLIARIEPDIVERRGQQRKRRQQIGFVARRSRRPVRLRQREGHALGLAAQPGVREAKARSEEHTSELQSLMRISYAVF